MTDDRRILASIMKHAKSVEEDPLTPLIDEYLLKREKPKYAKLRLKEYVIPIRPRVRPLGRLSPSSLVGCERQAAFKLLGAPGRKRTDPDTELIFEDGNWRHHKWQAMFYDMERVLGAHRFRVISIESRIEIRKLFVTGHLDAHIAILVNGVWIEYIVDFKGANEWAYSRVFRTREPIPEHIFQLHPYMKGKKVQRGMILYDSKDKNKFFVHPVAFDEIRWSEVRMWCRKVLGQVRAQELPPMHPGCEAGNFLGNKCPYRGLCYGDLSPRQIRRKVYKDFAGVDDLWRQGIEMEKLGDEEEYV